MRKYGLENFDLVILEECSPEELDQKEVYWIAYYDTYHNGYNETEGGDESHVHLGKPVELYDLEGNYVTEYPNITEAAKAIGVSRNTIYGIIYGDRLSTKGFQFKLKEDADTQITKYKNRQGGKIAINQYDKEGNFIREWESAAAAARELGLDSSSITKCLKNKLKSCGGFVWRYKT